MGFDLHDLQDALDAMEDRPPRAQRLAPSGESPAPGDLGLGDAEKSFLLLFMRSLARLIAEEVKAVVPVEKA